MPINVLTYPPRPGHSLCSVISFSWENCPVVRRTNTPQSEKLLLEVVVPTGVVSYVTGLDDSLDEVPDSQILTEECESVMEVQCGYGEEDGVETKTDREEVKLGGNGVVSRVKLMIVRYLLPYSFPLLSSSPHPTESTRS